MNSVETVSAVSRAVPRREAGILGRWARAGVLALAGTGVVGSGVYTGVNQYQQSQQVKELAGRLNFLNKEFNTRITLDQVMDVVKNITPSTVRVEGSQGLGSGVIIVTPQGNRYILTNGHVTQDNEFKKNEMGDSTYHIKLYNGTDYSSSVEFDAAPVILGNGQRAFSSPEEHDLALLQIPPNVKIPDGAGIVLRDLEADPVRVGEPVIVVGNPFGERDSVTFGIISHTDRQAVGLNKNHHFQTDAPINPGNSGGGLFDMHGRLIGINTWGYRGGDGVGGSIRVDEIIKMLKGWGTY